jgi:uncharacterized membrane protein
VVAQSQTQAPDAGAGGARPEMSRVVQRNIDALLQVRRSEERRRSTSDRIADTITAFAGSMWCVYAHALAFGAWIIINLGWVRGIRPFDPFPFVMLAMIASVEAIFLSTFILITQNRMQRLADRRAELDLQISLLSEHELTRAVRMIDDIAHKLGAYRPPEQELEEIKRDIHPQEVVREIEKAAANTEESA